MLINEPETQDKAQTLKLLKHLLLTNDDYD
jgi:hypothetical protein